MAGRRLRCLFLIVGLLCTGRLAGPVAQAGPAPAPGAGVAADQSTTCAQLAWYAGTMQAIGASIDAEEAAIDTDNMETWTAADYDNALAAYDRILAQLDRVTPPPALAAFHQNIRDGVALFQEALQAMKVAGPFAILAYLDQFDQLNQRTGALALPLEEECQVALFDNDGDGVEEIGPGVATPQAGDETASAEATPVALAPDGRPIMPIGTTVQTSDAFSLTIVSVDQNAVDAVPEAPPDGFQYVNVEIKLGHLRDQTDTFDLISLIALGPSGAVYSAVGNSCGFVDGPLAPGDYTGTLTMTGHVCFVVASRDVAGLALYDQTQPTDQRVYLSLDPAMS